MSEDKLLRPRQVTTAGWMIVLGSVAALISIWDHVSRLRSLDTREAVEATLGEPPWSALDLGVDDMLDVMHVAALITGACAAAAAVLGWQAMKRHKAARLVLTVIAVPLLFGGMDSGGFFTTLVAMSVVMLWLQPARDWFNGREPQQGAGPGHAQRPVHPAFARPSTTSEADTAPPPQAPTAPPATTGFGTTPPASYAPWGTGIGTMPAPDRRPAPVLVAAVLTWVFSGLGSAIMVFAAVMIGAEPDAVLDEVGRQQPDLIAQMEQQGITSSALVASAIASAVVVAIWSLAASVMAVFALRGKPWARTTWLVLVALAAVFLLFGAVLSFVLAIPMIAAVTTLSLLLRSDTRAWFASIASGGGPRN